MLHCSCSINCSSIYELVEIYLLSLLKIIIDKYNSGLYRNDGIILLNVNGQKMDHVRKNEIKIFEEVGFKTKIQTHLKIVNLLDVILSLANGIYRPYKPNDSLLCINKSSNHPPQVIKQLPTSINKKLSKNSSSEEFSTHQNENIKHHEKIALICKPN